MAYFVFGVVISDIRQGGQTMFSVRYALRPKQGFL